MDPNEMDIGYLYEFEGKTMQVIVIEIVSDYVVIRSQEVKGA